MNPSKRPLFWLLSALLYAILVWFATWPPGFRLDLFEYGTWLGPASDMLAGKVPYRETFPIHGFLSDGGIDYLLFRFTRPTFYKSIWLHQVIGVFFQPALLLVTAAATRRTGWAAFSVPVNLALSPALVFDRAVLPLLALAAFLWAIDERPRPAPAFLAGALSAVGVLYALDFGSFVLAAEVLTILAMLVYRRGEFSIRADGFGLGLSAIGVPFAVWMAAQRALIPFVKTSFIDLPRHIHHIWGLPFPAPLRAFQFWIMGRRGGFPELRDTPLEFGLRLYLIPVVALIALGLLFFFRSREGAATMRYVALLCATIFFFRYVLARYHHEAGNALTGPLTVVIVLLTCTATRYRPRIVTALALAATCALAVAGHAPGALYAILRSALSYSERMKLCPQCVNLANSRAGRARVLPEDSHRLAEVSQFVSIVAPQGPMFDLSNEPGLYFFLDRRNPTRFYQVPLMEPFQQEVIRDLERSPPALVILASDAWIDSPDGRSNAQRAPAVWTYIMTRYPRQVRAGGTLFGLPLRETPVTYTASPSRPADRRPDVKR